MKNIKSHFGVVYTCSHLVEMLSLTPEHREEIKPNMTIKEIREIKKEVKTCISVGIFNLIFNVKLNQFTLDKLPS